MTPIEMDTTQNDMQVTPTDVESSSAGDFSQSMQFTPPRIYEGDEGVVGEEVVVGEEAEEVVPIIQDQQLKLGKTIGGVDDPGNSKGKAFVID
uniref:Uncharacterized protein n=1 Tax=Lactuca sativa TaxID=4236 RepID=A0A9R1WID7_LACSA|nr:hypothetical protein LSAT_V11C100010900 [Lactuca sativa]